jgi:hypothetical protein
MGKIFLREIALILLSGLIAWWFIPALLGQPPAAPLFMVGLLMGLTFGPAYGVGLLGGQKMPAVVRSVLGVLAWVFTFWNDFVMVVSRLATGLELSGSAAYMRLAPGLFGLLLAVLGALRPQGSRRGAGALWALYAYSFPMAIVRWALVPMISVNVVLAAIAMQAGALYMLAHGLFRLFSPVSVETDTPGAEPLVRRRPVPDFLVGLAEGTLHKRARPFATQPDGGLDETVVSLAVAPDEVEGALQKLTAVIGDKPFEAVAGERVGEHVEIVLRPRVPPIA